MHTCSRCDSGADIDCTSCKLAELSRSQVDKRLREKAKAASDAEGKLRIDDDDDPSISERMTEGGNRLVIPLLFVCALLIFLLVILFTKLMA